VEAAASAAGDSDEEKGKDELGVSADLRSPAFEYGRFYRGNGDQSPDETGDENSEEEKAAQKIAGLIGIAAR